MWITDTALNHAMGEVVTGLAQSPFVLFLFGLAIGACIVAYVTRR